MEVTVDNSRFERPRRLVVGYSGSDPASNMRHLAWGEGLVGVGQGLSTAIVTDAENATSSMGFSIQDVLSADPQRPGFRTFALGNHAAILLTAPPGMVVAFRFAVCFHKGGSVTSGMDSSYLYAKYFRSVEHVAEYALGGFVDLMQASLISDQLANNQPQLNLDQRFQLIHAVRSYYGSTQLLQLDGRPYWVVNEGEYRMMNTFDLTVDQLFYELRMNPWTVRNVLDSYVRRYQVTDQVVLPDRPDELFPGGMSFTHDQGVGNAFSPAGRSAYEQAGLKGLFSHMTSEQLVRESPATAPAQRPARARRGAARR